MWIVNLSRRKKQGDKSNRPVRDGYKSRSQLTVDGRLAFVLLDFFN